MRKIPAGKRGRARSRLVTWFMAAGILAASASQLAAAPWAVWSGEPSTWVSNDATPSFKALRGTPISPAAAASYYGSATTSTDGLCRDLSGNAAICPAGGRPRAPELKEMARALRNDPDLIYEYVRNSIETELLFGAHKGALGTLIDRSGTAFDQAMLMVELLRESGITARYRYGDITLTGAEFLSWTGIQKARAACEVLAAGGIPATVNGGSDCNLAGDVASVVMSHVWVEAVIGGQTYQFDPAYKPHLNRAGIDVRSAMGFSTGQAYSATTAGVSHSPDGATVSGFANFGLASTLDGYTSALWTRFKQSDLHGANIKEVVGGSEILAAVRPTGGWRQVSLSQVSQVRATWSGGVPDQFRAVLTVAGGFPGGVLPISASLFTDEVYGRRVELVIGEGSTLSSRLVIDRRSAQQGATGNPNGESAYSATLSVNHPFSVLSGAYGDGTITRKLNVRGPTSMAVVFGFGSVSGRLGSKWSAETASQYFDAGGDPYKGVKTRALLGANWLGQFSKALWLHGRLADSRETHLHSLGFAFDIANPCLSYTCTSNTVDNVSLMDIETSVALTSMTNDAAARRAAILAIAATAATLEGSVSETSSDSPDSISTARRFAYANYPEENFYGFSNAYLRIGTTGTVPSQSAFAPAAAPGWSGTEARPTLVSALNAYHGAGFEIVTAVNALLGPGYVDGSHIPGEPDIRWPTTQMGGAFVAIKYDGNGDPIEIAHVATNYYTSSKGGGGNVPEVGPKDTADLLKDRFVDRSAALGVDLRSGAVGYTGPVVRSVGHGEFPFRLDESMSLRGGGVQALDSESYVAVSFPQMPEQRITSGLVSSFDGAAELSNSPEQAMGASRIEAAASTIAAFVALQDIYRAAAAPDREVAGLLAADWWGRRLLRNVVTIFQGGSASQHVLGGAGPTGSVLYLPVSGGSSRVHIVGPDPSLVRPDAGLDPETGWGGGPMPYRVKLQESTTIQFLDGAGGTRTYQYYRNGNYTGWEATFKQGFRLQSWTFSNGVVLTFNYPSTTNTNRIGVPTSVTSNLGYTLTLSTAPLTAFNAQFAGPFLCPSLSPDGAASSLPGSYFDQTFTSAGGGLTKLRLRTTQPWGLGQRPQDSCQLIEVYTPTNSSQPGMRYTYDTLGRVMEARDGVAVGGGRGPHQFFIAEDYRGERQDPVTPVGGRYAVEWLQDGRLTRNVDELGRVTITALDGRRRVMFRTYPEGDKDGFAYDIRDNITGLTRYPKPGSGLPNMVTTMTFAEGVSVRDCVNVVTCNRPLQVDGPRTDVTDVTNFSWDPATGNLVQILRPADSAGVRPQIDLAYTAFGPGISLVTSRTEKVTATTSTATTFEYNSANHYVMKWSTVDPGGLSLRTCYEFDTSGNLVGTSDPRTATCPGVPQ